MSDLSPARHLLIGPSADGLWVVCDEQGVCGAVFLGREEALRFARDEGGVWSFVPALDLATLFAPPDEATKLKTLADGQPAERGSQRLGNRRSPGVSGRSGP